MEFMVNKQTGERIPTAGITLYADLPVGSWVKNDMGTIPTGFLKEGDTISQSEYPELYAKYGSTVPYMADTSELSAYEDITFSNNQYKALYDGILELNIGANADTDQKIYVNNFQVVQAFVGGSASRETASINVKKGDVISYTTSYTGAPMIGKVAYYKKSLIVKAKSTGAPTDLVDGVRDALGSYSTTETVVGTWVDGKPIYRKVYHWDFTINAGDDYSYTVNFGQANFDTWIKTYYVGTRTNGTDKMTASFDTWTSNNFTAIKIWNSSKSAMHVNYIVLEYTKTTD